MRDSRVWMAVAALALAGPGGAAAARADDGPGLRLVRTIRVAADKESCYLSLSPDGRRLATVVIGGGPLCLWDTATGKQLALFRSPAPSGKFQTVAFAPDGRSLAAICDYGPDSLTLGLVDADSGRVRHRLNLDDCSTFDVSFSPDGRLLATVGGSSHSVVLWDTGTGKELRRLRVRDPRTGKLQDPHRKRTLARDPGFCIGARFAPDGKTLAVAVGDGTVRLCDPATGSEVQRLTHPEDANYASVYARLAFSPDGRLLAACNGCNARSPQCTARVWEVDTGRAVVGFRPPPVAACPLPAGQPGPLIGAEVLEFSPDGKTLVTAGVGLPRDGDECLRLWEVGTGGLRHEVHSLSGYFALSSQSLLVTADAVDGVVCLWDYRDPRLRFPASLAPADEDCLWAELASRDAATGYRAIAALRAAPRQATTLLALRLPAVTPEDNAERRRRVAELVADLDSDRFANRERASRKLADSGQAARVALRAALAGRPSTELRRRAEGVLKRLDSAWLTPEELRTRRSVEALEAIGTAEARAVLQRLADARFGEEETVDARAALDRLARRGHPMGR